MTNTLRAGEAKSIFSSSSVFLCFALIFIGVPLPSLASTGAAAFVSGTYTITPNSDGTTATVQVAGITNDTPSTTSGSLGFELWYSPTPYSGGTITGFKVAASYLPIGNCTSSQLSPGQSCDSITVQDNLTLPAAGTYYPVLLLVEYSSTCTTNAGYCSDDSINLINLVTGGPTVTVQSSSGGGTVGSAAGNVQFTGSNSVGTIDWTTDTVSNISVGGVQNTNSTEESGSIAIQLWFVSTPYTGGAIASGYKIASYPLPASCTTGQSQLPALKGCTAFTTGTLAAIPPPAGTYYAVLAVEEYNPSGCGTANGGYCIDQGLQLSNQVTVPATTGVGSGSGGSGGSSGTTGNIQFSAGSTESVGSIDWTNDTTSITVSGVTNITTNVTSGSIAIQLWFLSTPYTGGAISSGYKVASFPLPASCTTGQAQLAPGVSCSSISSGTITVTAPPAGTYYAVVAVEEYNSVACGTANGGYCIDQGVQLPNVEVVPAAQTTGPVTPDSGGGGSGGGGSVNTMLIALLTMLTLARTRRFIRR